MSTRGLCAASLLPIRLHVVLLGFSRGVAPASARTFNRPIVSALLILSTMQCAGGCRGYVALGCSFGGQSAASAAETATKHRLATLLSQEVPMLFALVVMAGVVLLVAVVNNRREPSWLDSSLPDGSAAGPQMGPRGRLAVATAVTQALMLAAAMVEAEPSGPLRAD